MDFTLRLKRAARQSRAGGESVERAACFESIEMKGRASQGCFTIRARLMLREEIRAIASQLKSRIAYYHAIYADPRTPRGAKILLWLAIGYTLLPFDLIPDFIPVIGHLDDVVIVPALLYLALRLVPADIKQAHIGLLQPAS